MGSCKTCKNWNNRECVAFDNVERNEKIPDTDAGIYADADDDSGLQWSFRTGPDFGCTKWRKK